MIDALELAKTYRSYGVIAFVVSLIGTAVFIRVATSLGVMDLPDRGLKPHKRPTPYLGGVAICLGWSVALLAAMIAGDVDGRTLLPILIGGILVSTVGLLDDLLDIAPKLRILLSALIIAAVMFVTGAGFNLADSLLEPLGIHAPGWLGVPVSFVVGLWIVLGACNSANLIDGLDGLCSGVTAIIAIGFFLLAAHLAVHSYSSAGDPVRLVLAVSLCAAALGFLPLNFHPAKIFMGDAGSMLLGYNCGIMILLFAERGIFRWVLGGLMVFGLPVADTALAIYRRWRSGRPIFHGDRSHFYDQLVDRGLSVRQVVAISYAAAALFAALGCLCIWMRTRHVAIIYVLVAILTVLLLRALRMTRADSMTDRPAGPMPAAEHPLTLLFTSAGRRVALINDFRRAAQRLGLDLRIHAADYQPTAPALQIVDERLIVPAVSSGEYCDQLIDHCRRHQIDALVPLIDPELRPLAEARERFAEIGTRAVISSPSVVGIAQDKVRTAEFLAGQGFLTPRVLAETELQDPQFPLFIKPRSGSSSIGAHRIDSAEDLVYYRSRAPASIVQEFIPGVEHTIDVFADFRGRARCGVPRRRHEVRGGEVSKGETIRRERMIQESCRLVDVLEGCCGVITIQCFLTPDNRIVFIEINPRFGGGVPLSIRAGADSPRWLLEMLLGREPEIRPDCWTDRLLMLRYDDAVFVSRAELPSAGGEA